VYRKLKRRTQISRISVAVCTALLVLFAAGYAEKETSDDYETTIQSKNLELESIKNELAQGRQKLKQLRTQEGSYVAQVKQVRRNIEISQTYLDKLNSKIASVTSTVKILEDSLNHETSEPAANRHEKTSAGYLQNRTVGIAADNNEFPQFVGYAAPCALL